jgi:hypothetical protein
MVYADEGQSLGARADNDIKSADLRAQTAEAAVAAQAEALEVLQAQKDAQAVELATARARLRRARAALAECRGTEEPPPTGPRLIGSSCEGGTSDWETFIGRIGHDLPIRRSYDQGGFDADFAHTQAGIDVGKRASFWSFKIPTGNGYIDWPKWAAGEYDNAIAKIMRSVPDQHTLLATPHHEPDGGGGQNQDGYPKDYRAGFARFANLMDTINAERLARGAKRILIGPCVMRGTLVYRKLDMNIWVPPADQIDFVAWDGYGVGVPTLDFNALFAPCVNWVKANRPGVPTVVGETGPWDYPAGTRADWVDDMVGDSKDAIDSGDMLAVCYWNSGQNRLVVNDEFAALGS